MFWSVSVLSVTNTKFFMTNIILLFIRLLFCVVPRSLLISSFTLYNPVLTSQYDKENNLIFGSNIIMLLFICVVNASTSQTDI